MASGRSGSSCSEALSLVATRMGEFRARREEHPKKWPTRWVTSRVGWCATSASVLGARCLVGKSHVPFISRTAVVHGAAFIRPQSILRNLVYGIWYRLAPIPYTTYYIIQYTITYPVLYNG